MLSGRSEEEAGIPKERYRPAKIFGKLREGDVLANRGRKVVHGTTTLGVTEVPDFLGSSMADPGREPLRRFTHLTEHDQESTL